MTVKGTGSGRAGKLRVRTQDKRWIEVPYGAGQDTNIRSINIWNGFQWVCPTWGRLLWPDMSTDPGLLANLNSLLFRKPAGFSWTGWSDSTDPNHHDNNPNYRTHDTSAQQWTLAYNANWERLFYLTPRTDPTWRIVPLRYPLPRVVPNVTLDFDSSDSVRKFNSFYPSVISNTLVLDDGQANPDLSAANGNLVDMTAYPFQQTQLCQAQYIHRDGPATDYNRTTWVNDRRTSQVASVDFRVIRNRLETIFPQQDVNFTGQKNNIAHQSLRRVMAKLFIQPLLTYWGEVGRTDGKDFDQVQFAIRAAANIDTHPITMADNVYNRGSFTINVPDSTDPQGRPIWIAAAQVLDRQMVVANFSTGAGGVTRHWNKWQLTTADSIPLDYDLEAPGENNLCFYPEILNPVAPASYLSEVTISLRIFVRWMNVQYSNDGYDVPDELKRSDAHP